MNKIIARWQDWTGASIEHLVLTQDQSRIIADAAIVGATDGKPFAARYRIVCDGSWRVKSVEMAEIGSNTALQLTTDGVGNWTDHSSPKPQLAGAIDVDISITPFTNSLPIRRMNLRTGESEQILVVYIRLPDLAISTDRQRYTCLAGGQRYRYESVDSDFVREIEVDLNGLVTTYPGLFRRIL
jgi:uncharacterized protein